MTNLKKKKNQLQSFINFNILDMTFLSFKNFNFLKLNKFFNYKNRMRIVSQKIGHFPSESEARRSAKTFRKPLQPDNPQPAPPPPLSFYIIFPKNSHDIPMRGGRHSYKDI